MGWRFRDRYKILPGVYLNVSSSGISFTFGPEGFNYNVGKNGIYQNVSIPGTGIYRRDRIGSGRRKRKEADIEYLPDQNTILSEKLAGARYFVEKHEIEIESTKSLYSKGIYDSSQYEAKLNELLESEKYLRMKRLLADNGYLE